jgi:hypothetical protein
MINATLFLLLKLKWIGIMVYFITVMEDFRKLKINIIELVEILILCINLYCIKKLKKIY